MKTKSNQPQEHIKLRILISLLAVLILAGGTTLLCRNHQKQQAIAKERAEYTQAETDLNDFKNQLVLKFGQAQDEKLMKECGHTSSEFGGGALYCDINEYVLYQISDYRAAQDMTSQIENMELIYTRLKTEAGPPAIASSSYSLGGLQCLTDVSYHQSTENLKSLGYTALDFKGTSQGLLIEMSCGVKHPKSAYFPIIN